MDKQEILTGLRDIISLYTEEQDALDHISEQTDFIADLKINSANLVDIVLDIEEKFNINIDNESMAKMLNVKATVEVIEDKLAENAGK
ncbi:phosphopantetheine-binding protein [Pedobacter sp. BMA]|uniref:phosphopantetheine-binding protein n=1 Tax=Pedobacter sp. BMA TaxID=1663685 RepID=UPI00064ADC41|nr:phosphopantetheine-binding protein [Pedobacter sp. BMA]KLT64298.1 acyl carrier protein [Pedobacter sp. BMA]